MRLLSHLRPATLNPTQLRTRQGLPYWALIVEFGNPLDCLVTRHSIESVFDHVGLNAEVQQFQSRDERHFVSIATTNALAIAHAELMDFGEGWIVPSLPSHATLEGGKTALRYEPGLN